MNKFNRKYPLEFAYYFLTKIVKRNFFQVYHKVRKLHFNCYRVAYFIMIPMLNVSFPKCKCWSPDTHSNSNAHEEVTKDKGDDMKNVSLISQDQ